jgi:uncharacterized membrane protein YdbT with pleckstrin-like domain
MLVRVFFFILHLALFMTSGVARHLLANLGCGSKSFRQYCVFQFPYNVIIIIIIIIIIITIIIIIIIIITIIIKYLGTTLTNQNSVQEEIKSRVKSGNACYHSVQNLLFSSLL